MLYAFILFMQRSCNSCRRSLQFMREAQFMRRQPFSRPALPDISHAPRAYIACRQEHISRAKHISRRAAGAFACQASPRCPEGQIMRRQAQFMQRSCNSCNAVAIHADAVCNSCAKRNSCRIAAIHSASAVLSSGSAGHIECLAEAHIEHAKHASRARAAHISSSRSEHLERALRAFSFLTASYNSVRSSNIAASAESAKLTALRIPAASC